MIEEVPVGAKRNRIIFFFPVYTEFVKKDEAMYRRHFNCQSYLFDQKPGKILFSFWKQLIFLMSNANQAEAFVSFFAGYSSFLPSLLSRLLGKPHVLILGGTDCAALPEINYGNFRKQPLAWVTRKTIEWASHLVPVHASIINFDYQYIPVKYSKQGFQPFCPEATAPITVVSTAYDSQRFYCDEEKVPKSFITVGQLDPITFYRKGIDLILEMASRFPDCRFTIVGAHKELMDSPVSKNVKLIPRVPNNEIRALLGSQQFYLQLSMMEGLPNALCEAMLCECIPIGSDVAGIPDGIGETGFILQHKNADELQNLIQTALKQSNLALGKMARKRIMDQYPMKVREQLVDIIRLEIIRTNACSPFK